MIFFVCLVTIPHPGLLNITAKFCFELCFFLLKPLLIPLARGKMAKTKFCLPAAADSYVCLLINYAVAFRPIF